MTTARRVLIVLLLAYAVAGTYAAETLPLSSPRPPEWYHHPAVVLPAVVLMAPFTGGGLKSPWQRHWRAVVVWSAMFVLAWVWFLALDAIAVAAGRLLRRRA